MLLSEFCVEPDTTFIYHYPPIIRMRPEFCFFTSRVLRHTPEYHDCLARIIFSYVLKIRLLRGCVLSPHPGELHNIQFTDTAFSCSLHMPYRKNRPIAFVFLPAREGKPIRIIRFRDSDQKCKARRDMATHQSISGSRGHR
jgi:hypothetical protein